MVNPKRGLRTDSILEYESFGLIDNGDDTNSFARRGKRYMLTKKRFLLLALVCFIILLDTFGVMFFAFVHDVTSAYYRTPTAVTDLLSTVSVAGRGLFSVVIAIMSDKVNLRDLALTAPGAIFTGSIILAVGITSRRNFEIALLGQIAGGPAFALGVTLGKLISANWFPKPEQGKCNAIAIMMSRLAQVISNIAATRLLGNISSERYSNMNSSSLVEDTAVENFGIVYPRVYAILSAMAFLTFVVAQQFVTSYPPLILSSSSHHKVEITQDWSLSCAVWDTLKLFTSKIFLFLILSVCIVDTVRPLIDVLLSSIVVGSFPHASDQFAGTLFCVGLAAGGVSILVGGAVIDKFQSPKYVYLAGVALGLTGCIIFSVSIQKQSVALLYVGYILINVARDVMLISTSVSALQVLMNEPSSVTLRVMSLLTSLPLVLIPFFSLATRKILDNFGARYAVLFPFPFLFVSAILWITCYKIFDSKKLFQ